MSKQDTPGLIETLRNCIIATQVRLPQLALIGSTSYDGRCPRCDEELVWNQDWLTRYVEAKGRLSSLEPDRDGKPTQVVSFYERCPNCHTDLHVAARIAVTFDIGAMPPEPEGKPHEFYD